MTSPMLKDAMWVRQAFLVKKLDLAPIDQLNRTFSTASLKFTDTTPGGNFAINPPPQFTRNADLKVMGKHSASKGMGRYYSEAIDDNSQLIHMRFGVPQFNSLKSFFTSFYDSEAGSLARTGRVNEAFYLLGRAAGLVVQVVFWPLLAVQFLGTGLRFALQKPSSKFYFSKPVMPLYWNAVQTMVNQICVNQGIVPRAGGNGGERLGGPYDFTKEAMEQAHKTNPDLFSKNGGIDVYALATKAQRLSHQQKKKMEAALDASTPKTALETLWNTVTETLKEAPIVTFQRYIDKWKASDASKNKTDGSVEKAPEDGVEEAGFFDFFEAEMYEGGAFATFRVNSTGSVSESFASQVTESEISSKMNGMSSSSRSSKFNFANGNAIDGIAGEVMGAVFGAVQGFVAGAANQVGLQGMAMLGGAAFVDIPKHWQSSSASLPRASYTMHLTSPYGNPVSQLINMYIPLAMILAGGLPLSTGKHSYTSPFLVELYDQGRCQTRLGMIDSISITRGVGNFGFDNGGRPMAIDVTFSIVDMSSILHMPIAQGLSPIGNVAAKVGKTVADAGAALGAETAGAVVGGILAGAFFDDDSSFTDYMATLGHLGLADQIYSMRKLKMNLTMRAKQWDSWASQSHFASYLADFAPVRLWAAQYRGTVK